jgi:hypothetical protein
VVAFENTTDRNKATFKNAVFSTRVEMSGRLHDDFQPGQTGLKLIPGAMTS